MNPDYEKQLEVIRKYAPECEGIMHEYFEKKRVGIKDAQAGQDGKGQEGEHGTQDTTRVRHKHFSTR